MQLTIKLYGIYKEKIGNDKIILDIDKKEVYVGDIVDLLKEKYSEQRELFVSSRIALNQKFAKIDDKINESDEIALLPPVSGG